MGRLLTRAPADDAYGSEDDEEDWEEDGIDPDNMTYEVGRCFIQMFGANLRSKFFWCEMVSKVRL